MACFGRTSNLTRDLSRACHVLITPSAAPSTAIASVIPWTTVMSASMGSNAALQRRAACGASVGGAGSASRFLGCKFLDAQALSALLSNREVVLRLLIKPTLGRRAERNR